ncbi:hypothetical protein NRA60_14135 [Acinetobacter baumannii]|nr:hypothetical protein [Acinetobacter baumannii]
MRIGFICEGVTDLAVLQNVFFGLFDEDELDITELAPPPIDYSKPTYQRNDRKGGWERLKDFLTTSEFKTQLAVHDYILIHIDSDEGYHPNFGVEIDIKKNGDHSQFIIDIENKLKEWINNSSHIQYEPFKNKIIFCICVHSIECWIMTLYNQQSKEIVECESKMFTYLTSQKIKANKDAKSYRKLTTELKKRKCIKSLTQRSQSFNHFISNINKIVTTNPIYSFIGIFNYRAFICNEF